MRLVTIKRGKVLLSGLLMWWQNVTKNTTSGSTVAAEHSTEVSRSITQWLSFLLRHDIRACQQKFMKNCVWNIFWRSLASKRNYQWYKERATRGVSNCEKPLHKGDERAHQKIHFLCDRTDDWITSFYYVPNHKMGAHSFTKSLSVRKAEKFKTVFMGRDSAVSAAEWAC